MTSSPLDARRVGAQRPRVASFPDHAASSADEAVEFAESLGIVLDPWEVFVLEHGMGEREDGSWSAFQVGCWVPRQNGKGMVTLVRELAGLFVFGERLILHSAHKYPTAQEGFLKIKEVIDGSDELRPLVKAVRVANGEQGIELRSGQRLRFLARSLGAGRGFSGDLNVLDEAQYLTSGNMAAIMPTMAARPNPQLWYFGTPPEHGAAWCYGLREDGEAGAERFAWFDWGADLDPTDPADIARADDVDLWYETNPGLGIRISEEYVRSERKTLREKFLPERLGVWPVKVEHGSDVLDPLVWDKLTDTGSRIVGDRAFAFDVSPMRDSATINVYGLRGDRLGHLEMVERRPGTDWLVDRLVQLRDRWDPVAIGLDGRGPGASLLTELKAAGITLPEDPAKPKRGDLLVMTGPEMAQASGQLSDAVKAGQVRHLAQPELNMAVAGARTKPAGDAYVWARRAASVDICPLVAGTVARWTFMARAALVADDYDLLDSVL